MIRIDYTDKFIIGFSTYLNPQEFMDFVSLFQKLGVKHDKDTSISSIDENRIEELLIYFDKKCIDYTFTQKAIDRLNIIFNEKSEITISRGRNLFDYSVLKSDIKLFPFQDEDINRIIKYNRFVLGQDAGLGKTLILTSIFSHLYKKEKIDKIFIIARPGISYNWKKSILKFSSLFSEEDIAIIDNSNKRDVFENTRDKKIIITSNHLIKDIILYYKKNYKFGKSAVKIRWKQFVDIEKYWGQDLCLIVDEAHEFENPQAVKSKALENHKHFFKYRYLASATFGMNYFEKWWNIIRLIDENSVPQTFNAFKFKIAKDFGDEYGFANIKEYDVEEISAFKRNVLSRFVIRRLKKDIPEIKYKKYDRPIYFDLTKKHKELYHLFVANELYKMEGDYQDITLRLLESKYPYLSQVLDNPFLLQGKEITFEKEKDQKRFNQLLRTWKLTDDSRIKYVDTILDEKINLLNGKVVLFDNHPLTINMLAERYKKYNPLIMHGELHLTEEEKNEIRDLFNDKNSKYKMFIGNPSVAGVGTDLNESEPYTIFYTLPDNAVLFVQALERVFRINNTANAIIDLCVIDNTMDVRRYMRNRKRNLINNDLLTKPLTDEELYNFFNGKE